MSKNIHRPSKRKKFWQAKIEEHQASGLSVSEFCRNNGLSPNRFYYWRKKISELSQTSNGRQTFVPVQVAYGDIEKNSGAANPPVGEPAIEILHHSGHKLCVRSGFDSATLSRVLAVLDKIIC